MLLYNQDNRKDSGIHEVAFAILLPIPSIRFRHNLYEADISFQFPYILRFFLQSSL